MLKTLIVDDEPLARKRLTSLLKPYLASKRIALVGEAEDGAKALEIISQEPVDLVFLDIQMPEMDGFDVLERIPPDRQPVVVFTTAFDAYAVRAFESNALDYLLKPVSQERLETAIARAQKVHQAEEARAAYENRVGQLLDWMEEQAKEAAKPPTEPPAKYLEQISIPYRDRILIIPVQQLISAEISESITRLHILVEEPGAPRPRLRQHVVSLTLEQLEASLDPDDFMRVHRSAIVQIQAIRELIPWFSGRYKLILQGDHEIIASRERSRHLKERLMI